MYIVYPLIYMILKDHKISSKMFLMLCFVEINVMCKAEQIH